MDFIDNTILTLADLPEAFDTPQFDSASWPGIVSQHFHRGNDPPLNVRRQFPQLPIGRRLEGTLYFSMV